MAQVFRWFLGRFRGRVTCTFSHEAINHQSVVLVAASEGDRGDSSASPQRKVGSASIRVENIAPFDRMVVFRVFIEWDDPLPVWADIFVADEFPQGFFRSR
jgi:hypothetical protein